MKTLKMPFEICLWWAAAMVLTACGGTGDDFDNLDSGSASVGILSDFDESQLPDDFPKNLIPPDYASGGFTELGRVATASFESNTPIGESVAHYTDLLGEPGLDNESPNGERTTQWDVSPWTLSLVGSASESIVGISKISE